VAKAHLLERDTKERTLLVDRAESMAKLAMGLLMTSDQELG